MKVRCERDGATFNVIPRLYPSEENPSKEYDCLKAGYRFPCRFIDCITCCRRYIQETDGQWISDRPLTILEDETS